MERYPFCRSGAFLMPSARRPMVVPPPPRSPPSLVPVGASTDFPGLTTGSNACAKLKIGPILLAEGVVAAAADDSTRKAPLRPVYTVFLLHTTNFFALLVPAKYHRDSIVPDDLKRPDGRESVRSHLTVLTARFIPSLSSCPNYLYLLCKVVSSSSISLWRHQRRWGPCSGSTLALFLVASSVVINAFWPTSKSETSLSPYIVQIQVQ